MIPQFTCRARGNSPCSSASSSFITKLLNFFSFMPVPRVLTASFSVSADLLVWKFSSKCPYTKEIAYICILTFNACHNSVLLCLLAMIYLYFQQVPFLFQQAGHFNSIQLTAFRACTQGISHYVGWWWIQREIKQ